MTVRSRSTAPRFGAEPSLSSTGAARPWWAGERGEWWAVAQFVLLALALALPPAGTSWPVAMRVVALPLGLAGALMIGLGAAALGSSLTILPRPKPDGQFIATGVYKAVRHPIYGGVILVAFAWSSWRASLAHLILAVGLVVFFAAKARYEETWLIARFPEYADYRRRVRAFVPWIY